MGRFDHLDVSHIEKLLLPEVEQKTDDKRLIPIEVRQYLSEPIETLIDQQTIIDSKILPITDVVLLSDKRSLFIEAMLDEAATLLERGLADRDEAYDFASSASNDLISLLYEHHSASEENDRARSSINYIKTIQKIHKNFTSSARVSLNKSKKNVTVRITKYLRGTARRQLINASGILARLSFTTPVTTTEKPTGGRKLTIKTTEAKISEDSIVDSRRNHADRESRRIAHVDETFRRSDLYLRRGGLGREKTRAIFERNLSLERLKIEKGDQQSAKDKATLRAKEINEKVKLFFADDSALSKLRRLAPIRARFAGDFRIARRKLRYAYGGLSQLYPEIIRGREFPGIVEVDQNGNERLGRDVLDEHINFIRELINDFNMHSKLEQDLRITIDIQKVLRGTIKDVFDATGVIYIPIADQRAKLLEAGFDETEHPYLYELSSVLSAFEKVRIRGVFMEHRGLPQDTFRVQVQPPFEKRRGIGFPREMGEFFGYYTRVGNDEVNLAAQEEAEATIIGDVSHYSRPSGRAIIGASIWYNMSPLGVWRVVPESLTIGSELRVTLLVASYKRGFG